MGDDVEYVAGSDEFHRGGGNTVVMNTHRVETAEADLVYDVHGPLPTADGRPPLFMIGQPRSSTRTTDAAHSASPLIWAGGGGPQRRPSRSRRSCAVGAAPFYRSARHPPAWPSRHVAGSMRAPRLVVPECGCERVSNSD